MGWWLRLKTVSPAQVKYFSQKVRDYLERTANQEADYPGKIKTYGFLATPEYRYLHTLKVLDYALQICQREGGRTDVVILAALFHDMERFTTTPLLHGQKGAVSARKILKDHGFVETLTQPVYEAIYHHVAQKNLPGLSLEGAVLVEADHLDKLGNKGIMVQFMIGGREGQNFQEIITSYQQYLVRRGQEERRIFRTETGKSLLEAKLLQQDLFFQGLKEDLILDGDSFFNTMPDRLRR